MQSIVLQIHSNQMGKFLVFCGPVLFEGLVEVFTRILTENVVVVDGRGANRTLDALRSLIGFSLGTISNKVGV